MDNSESAALYVKRQKIQNRWVKGYFQNIRVATSWLTLSWFFLAPWLMWHGRQALLLDVADRKFYLWALTFWPQDFFLVLCLAIIAALSLIVVTNLAGRIWCGYTCPQTVWTRWYMWIEYLTEGDRNKRLKRDQHPWEFATALRRSCKHFLWLLLALFTSLTFVGYFVPIRNLFIDVVSLHIDGLELFWIGFFTLATYINAGWMREQICLHICPYARFQSVLFDRNTLTISYDFIRGEPRGARKNKVKHDAKKLGDCIDCQLCVHVCPTGIDIRKGLQLGCIGCAACVDACDQVMEKMDYPQGLIRYSTENALEGKKSNIIRPRLVASLAILVLMMSIFVYAVITRLPLQFDVLHDHHNLYRLAANGDIENSYVLKIDNMSQESRTYLIQLISNASLKYVGPRTVSVPAGEILTVPVTLHATPHTLKTFNTLIQFFIVDTQDKRIQKINQSNFFSPQEP